MNTKLKEKLIAIAYKRIGKDDPSHDIEHALRVMKNAETIAKNEKGDLDIVIPSALFHDLVNHPKISPRAKFSSDESADATAKILEGITEYPQKKIKLVHSAIKTCSFSKGIVPTILEAKILQDADGLEATGAISIMRTYASAGSWGGPFYNVKDPFCSKRDPDPKHFALDLFYSRLLVVQKRMHTKTAKAIAKKRTQFLYSFLKQFKQELQGK